MGGGIYTEERCPICNGRMTDNHRDAVACPAHPKMKVGAFKVKLTLNGKSTQRRFKSYEEARRFLTGLQFKVDEGSFDARDYRADEPLGFRNLADQWLEVKKTQIKRHSWDTLNNVLRKAGGVWGNRNIKEIGYAEIEDFLHKSLAGLSSKSRANAASVLHSFFDWLRRRRVLSATQLPEFPEVSFDLAFRKTISKSDQERILRELQDITVGVNPRIHIAARWLATYFSIRPGELIRLKEGEIDREQGFLIIPHPKEKRPKVVPLIEKDLELVRSLPRAFPDLPFFRHLHPRKGVKVGTPFAPDYVREWWLRACANLGIEGVDLYGGTRHSTVIALGEHFTPEQLKAASFHSTNKAFERYFRIQPDQVRDIYAAGRKELAKKEKNDSSGRTRKR